MQQTMLFGLPVEDGKCRKSAKLKRKKKQHRRQDWEDHHEPEFFTSVAMPIVPPDVFAGVEKESLSFVRKYASRFHLPIEIPDGTPKSSIHALKRVVYRLRHANRLPLSMPGDHYDLVNMAKGIEELCEFYREEMLASKGLRSAAHGISRLDPNDESKGFRVQIWDSTRGPIGGHLHVKYTKTKTEAFEVLAAWWLKHRKIDIHRYVCYNPETAIGVIADCHHDAVVNASKEGYCDISVSDIFGDDDDD